MPKKIFYCVDFHCPAGGMLGYDGGAGGRLGGRRRPGGYLRESDVGNTIGQQLLDAINSSEIAKNGIYIAYPGRRTAFTFTVDSFDSGVLTLTGVVNGNKKIQDFLRELRSVGVGRISDITRIVTTDDKTVDGAWECSKINPPNSMGNIFIEMKKIPDNTDYKSEFGDLLRESDNGTPVSDILVAYKELPEGLKKDVEQIATSPDGVMAVKHKDGKFTVVEGGKPVMERVSADEVRKSGKLGKKQVTVMTKDELSKMLSECDDADPEQMMKEFVEKKRKCGVKEDEYRRPKNQPHNLHQVDEGEDVDEDEDVEEDEYRRPKNQPHNLHSIDESDAWVVDIDADGQDDVQFIVYASSEEDARKEAENEIKSHKLKNAKVKNIRPKDEKSKDDNDIEDAEDVFDEDESQFELNESMVRFCDRLIRG